mgnify:CR=1 FL=1
MFGPSHSRLEKRIALAAVLSLVVSVSSLAAAGEFGSAIVPVTIIYPGQQIEGGQIHTVDVTNPNLMEGYAREASEVEGMITTKTLLPGRTIMISALRKPYTVKRGDKIVLVYDNGGLRITASGTPLADALTGDLIKVRNTDTGVILSGTVMADGTILVAQK